MSNLDTSASDDVADRLFQAIERGDKASIEALFSDDVTVWHTGDRRDNDRVRALKVMHWFIDTTTERRYQILDRQPFEGGFVQQHVLHATGKNAGVIALRVCIVIKTGIKEGQAVIHRIDEYFDPADMAALMA